MIKDSTTFDPVTGLQQTMKHTESGFTVETKQNVQPFLDYAAALRAAEGLKAAGIKRGWMHAAIIPPVLVHKWLKEGFNVFREPGSAIAKRLRSSEYAHLRTVDGKI